MAFAELTTDGECCCNVLPRAAAGISQALASELVQRLLVKRAALRLVERNSVWQQTAGGQLPQDRVGCTGHAARRVDIFDAHQPLTAVGAGVKPAGQRRHQ